MSRALVLQSTLLLLLAGAIIVFVVLSRSFPTTAVALNSAPTLSVNDPAPPTADDLEVIMRRLDLAPEHLAAAGLTPQQATALVSSMGEPLLAAAPALAEADLQLAAARSATDALRRIIRSGQATQEDITLLATAQAQLQQVESTRDGILANLFALIHEYLAEGQAQKLTTIKSNSHWNLPIQYKVVNRTQAEWVALREALADDRISSKLGEEPDEDAQSLLAQADANQAVMLAAAALETNLAQITAAVEQSLAEEAVQE